MKKVLLLLTLAALLCSKELSIASPDGFKLYGWLDKPISAKGATPIILFAHQFGADHSTWDAIAKEFTNREYATLRVDLRGHGKSTLQNEQENSIIAAAKLDEIKEAIAQSDKKVGFEKIPSDLLAWLEYIAQDQTVAMENLYLFGASLGGASIIPLLNEYEVKGVVILSGGKPKALQEDIDLALATSMSKTLFIASSKDPLNAANTAVAYGQKSILGTSLIVYGDGHGTVLLPVVKEYIFSFMKSL